MPGFPGIDASSFIGDAELAWLKANSNLTWCGYYLGPAPSHADRSWMGHRAALQSAGWGLAPVYVGQQIGGPGRHNVSSPQGMMDGKEAAQLMNSEGFAASSCVYLDLEDGPPYSPPRTGYVANWIAAVRAGGFQAGVYCSHAIAAAVHAADSDTRIWAFKVQTADEHPFPGVNFPDIDPAGCGYPGAYIWQLGQNCRLTLSGAPNSQPLVDLNSCVGPDPSAP